MKAFWTVFLSMCLYALLTLLHAGVAVWLWHVIIVPVFMAPSITFWQMYGIIWFLRFIWPNAIQFGENDE